MNLKELRDEIKELIDFKKLSTMSKDVSVIKLEGIKQTVEAVDNSDAFKDCSCKDCLKEWQEIKELLKSKRK